MDTHVAQNAILPERVLWVRARWNTRMALQAERVHARGQQHARIGRPVRGVASLASLSLDRFVLEDERSTLVAMALQANHILIRGRSKLAISQRAVRIVAIGTLDQPFFHAMMERLLEIRSLFYVARKAQRRLLLYQQIFQRGVVHGVTGGAGDAVLVVGGTHELALLRIRLVAGQATLGNGFRLRPCESEDLGLVSASLHMRRAGTMAALTTLV